MFWQRIEIFSFFLLLCFFVLFLFFYFIKISKFALPGVMFKYERTSKDRKRKKEICNQKMV